MWKFQSGRETGISAKLLFIWSNSSAFHCPAKALCASDTRLAQTETGSIDHTTLHMQRDSAICGRQAAENAACVHIFVMVSRKAGLLLKKTAKSEKVLKKDAIYLFRAMLDCPGGSLFKGFRIYSFYGI